MGDPRPRYSPTHLLHFRSVSSPGLSAQASDSESEGDEEDKTNRLLQKAQKELRRGRSRSDSNSRAPTPSHDSDTSDTPFNFIEEMKLKVSHIRGHKVEEVDEGKLLSFVLPQESVNLTQLSNTVRVEILGHTFG
jgi:hypothetical protein